MQRNFMTVTYAYHFIAESMIAFLLSIPIFHLYYEKIPYVEYSVVLIGLTCIYAVLLHRVTSYIPYVLLTPFVAVGFYVLAFPLWICITFAVLFARSAITLRRESSLDKEGLYLRIILIISIIIPLFIHDMTFIFFVVGTLLLLILGNIMRNMTVLSKKDRRGKSTWFMGGVLAIIIASVIVIYFSFTLVRTAIGFIWGVITSILMHVGSFFVYLLSLIPIPDAQEEGDDETIGGEPEDIPENFDSSETLIDQVFTWALIIGAIIIAFFVIRFALRLMKQRFKPLADDEEHVAYEEIGAVAKRKQRWKDRFRNFMPAPKDHVRKRMYQFEKKMHLTERGRAADETIEEWVQRSGWTIDFELYQRVRYGTYTARAEEVAELKRQMTYIEDAEKKRKKDRDTK